MGTTAEKGAYIIETKSLLKDKINNLGGSIDEQTTFRQYANQLQNVYDNLPKTEYQEGTEVNLGVTLKGKLDFENGVVGIGQSSQDSTQGYNFANLNGMNTTTNNGITFTINRENGLTKSVKINGTSVNYDSYCIGTAYLLPAGTYVVYGNGVTNNIITQIVNDTQTAQLGYSGKDDNTMTLAQDTNIIVRLRVTVGSTINNVEVKPMIATTSGKDFEPYTGGQASPNPSYPQEIKYVRGRNRLQLENGTNTTYNVTAITENGKITLNGTPNSNTYSRLISTFTANTTDIFTLSPNKSATNSDIRLLYTINDGSLVNSDNTPQISLNIGDVVKVYLRISTTSQITNFTLQPQLEEGTTSTPYLPYNTIEEVVSGINYCNLSNSSPESTTNINISINDNSSLLFDSNGETVQDSKNIFDSFTLPKVATLPKGDYTFAIQFIGDCNVSVNTIASYLKASASVNSGTYATCTNVGIITNGTIYATRFTLTEEKDVYLQVFTNSQNKKFTNTQMRFMIYSGSYPTTTDIPTYEPYITPTSYQLSLGDIELCGIGNYKDELIYDVDEDKVYKNEKIGRNDFNENLSYEDFSAYWGQGSFGTRLTNIGTDKIAWSDMLCKYFVAYTSSETKNLNNEMVVGTSSMIFNNPNISTLTEWISWVTTHHFSVFYPKSTPTLTEITDTNLHNQVKMLYNAQSLNGTTIVTSSGNLPMIIKIRALKGSS